MNARIPKRVAVVSLRAENVAETAHFYRDVLGLPVIGHHGGRPHFQIGETILVILPGAPDLPGGERFPRLAFAVDDLDGAVKNLQAYAIALPWGIEANPQSRWVMFSDPAGNLIELVQFAVVC
jgi:catechol 2,3-dioxygenase-like lactoylglutathione lyase family enzyme